MYPTLKGGGGGALAKIIKKIFQPPSSLDCINYLTTQIVLDNFPSGAPGIGYSQIVEINLGY